MCLLKVWYLEHGPSLCCVVDDDTERLYSICLGTPWPVYWSLATYGWKAVDLHRKWPHNASVQSLWAAKCHTIRGSGKEERLYWATTWGDGYSCESGETGIPVSWNGISTNQHIMSTHHEYVLITTFSFLSNLSFNSNPIIYFPAR